MFSAFSKKIRENCAFLVDSQQIELIYADARRSFVINALALVIFALTLHSSLPVQELTVWLICMSMVMVLRFAFVLVIDKPAIRQRLSEKVWRKSYLILIGLSGVVWGATILFWQPSQPPTTQLLLLLFPIALSAGAVSTLGAWCAAYFVFLLPCLLPITVKLLIVQQSQYWATAIASGFYLVALVVLGVNYQARIKEVLKLKDGNSKLIENLSSQNELLLSAIDQAESANIAKSEFLARISHELRTPINGILGSNQVMQSTQMSARQAKLSGQVERSAESLLLIVDDVLEFAELEEEVLHLSHNEFELNAMLTQIECEVAERAKAKGIEFRVLRQNDLPKLIIGDEKRLKKVLNNLIDNAIKFTTQGFVELNISSLEKCEGSEKILWSVQDSGKGIETDDQHSIFESFTQADNTSTRSVRGLGLGLTIAQRWVKLMGGSIALQSVPGVGSNFSFSVWLDRASEQSPSTESVDGRSLAGMNILVVEDSEINQAVVEALLETMGCTVVIAENGQIAVDMLREKTFHLVLMDCQMPVMDGYEATRQIRKLDRQNDIKILALTANAMPGDREKCLQAGMDDYITKPFEAEELERMICMHLYSDNKPNALDESKRSNNAMSQELSGSALDATVLENLRTLDKGKGLIVRVIDAFNTSIPTLMADLKQGIEEQDVEKVRMPAHTMKSSAANLGALAFSQQCAIIENMARQGDLSSMEKEFSLLEQLLTPVEAELAMEREQAEARKAA